MLMLSHDSRRSAPQSIFQRLSLPTVETKIDDQVFEAIAMLVGYVESPDCEPPLECGFVYGLKPNPTWDDNISQATIGSNGIFKKLLTDLSPDTQYFVRAYAVTAAWVVYGDDLLFHTKPRL